MSTPVLVPPLLPKQGIYVNAVPHTKCMSLKVLVFPFIFSVTHVQCSIHNYILTGHLFNSAAFNIKIFFPGKGKFTTRFPAATKYI